MDRKGSNDSWRVKDIFYALAIYFMILMAFILIEAHFVGQIVFRESQMPPLLFLFEEIINALILISVTLYFVKWRYNEAVTNLGLHTRMVAKNIGIGILTGFLIWLALISLSHVVRSLIGAGPIEQPLVSRLEGAGNLLDYVVVITSGGIVAPISEEIFFRGFTYTILKAHYTMFIAVVLTNLLFFVVHLSPWWFIQVFAVGVMFTVVYEYSGSLVSAIVAHSAVNLLSVMRYLLNSSFA